MTEHLDPRYDEHSQESRRHRSRRSSSVPSALWMILGALVALLIVLAVRGPSAIVINNSDCCCCQTAPCKPAGATILPETGDRIGQTPAIPPVPPLPAPETSSPCCNGPEVATRTARPVPVLPFWNNGGGSGGGGDKKNGGDRPVDKPTPIPEPTSIALIALGVVAWRAFV